MLWSFARDGGVPMYKVWAAVSPFTFTPVNAGEIAQHNDMSGPSTVGQQYRSRALTVIGFIVAKITISYATQHLLQRGM